ncbi:MAG: hypothetical protein ACOY5H_02340 [Pseudomonadota bacterium]
MEKFTARDKGARGKADRAIHAVKGALGRLRGNRATTGAGKIRASGKLESGPAGARLRYCSGSAAKRYFRLSVYLRSGSDRDWIHRGSRFAFKATL